MSTNGSHRIDRDTAEQLLGGAKVGSEADQASLTEQHAALAGLLASVAAPTADGPLPGEERAMAAFREARRNPAPQPRRRTMVDTARAAFSAKALAAAFAVTALGGVAVAVTGGGGSDERASVVTGPSPSADRSPSAVNGPGAPGTRPSAGSGTSGQGTGRPPTAGTDRGTAPGGASGSATDPAAGTDLVGLCHVLDSRTAAGAKAGDVLADPSLQPLVRAAGGPDKVDGYCTAAAKSKDQGSASPSHGGGKPSSDPSKGGPDPAPTDSSAGSHGGKA